MIATSHGLKLGGGGYAFFGDYPEYGLYYYDSGEYAGMAFFGLGGDVEKQKARKSGGRLRVTKRCKEGDYIEAYGDWEE